MKITTFQHKSEETTTRLSGCVVVSLFAYVPVAGVKMGGDAALVDHKARTTLVKYLAEQFVRDRVAGEIFQCRVLKAKLDDVKALRGHLKRGKPDAFVCGTDVDAAIFKGALKKVGLSVELVIRELTSRKGERRTKR